MIPSWKDRLKPKPPGGRLYDRLLLNVGLRGPWTRIWTDCKFYSSGVDSSAPCEESEL